MQFITERIKPHLRFIRTPVAPMTLAIPKTTDIGIKKIMLFLKKSIAKIGGIALRSKAPLNTKGISIKPEKSSYKAGELAFININLVGENGIVESKADRKLTVRTHRQKRLLTIL